VHPRAVAAARRHHLHPGAIRPRGLEDVLRPGDLVVAVCDNAHEQLAIAPPGRSAGSPGSWLHWAVPDPARVGTDEAFEAAFEDVSHRVGGGAPPQAPRRATDLTAALVPGRATDLTAAP
jgi:protein-tyrosine-phosphatase